MIVLESSILAANKIDAFSASFGRLALFNGQSSNSFIFRSLAPGSGPGGSADSLLYALVDAWPSFCQHGFRSRHNHRRFVCEWYITFYEWYSLNSGIHWIMFSEYSPNTTRKTGLICTNLMALLHSNLIHFYRWLNIFSWWINYYLPS